MNDKNRNKKQCVNCKGFKFYIEPNAANKKEYIYICCVCGTEHTMKAGALIECRNTLLDK